LRDSHRSILPATVVYVYVYVKDNTKIIVVKIC